MTLMCLESCLVLLPWSQPNLVIACSKVEFGEPRYSVELIQKFLDNWNWKLGNDSEGIEVTIVNA